MATAQQHIIIVELTTYVGVNWYQQHIVTSLIIIKLYNETSYYQLFGQNKHYDTVITFTKLFEFYAE